MCPQACLEANLVETFYQLRYLFLDNSRLYQVDQTNKHNNKNNQGTFWTHSVSFFSHIFRKNFLSIIYVPDAELSSIYKSSHSRSKYEYRAMSGLQLLRILWELIYVHEYHWFTAPPHQQPKDLYTKHNGWKYFFEKKYFFKAVWKYQGMHHWWKLRISRSKREYTVKRTFCHTRHFNGWYEFSSR